MSQFSHMAAGTHSFADTDADMDIRRMSRDERLAKLGHGRAKTSLSLFPTASQSVASGGHTEQASKAKTALFSLKPMQVFARSVVTTMRATLAAVVDAHDEADLDAVDTAQQLLERMEPSVHPSLNNFFQDVFNALWCVLFTVRMPAQPRRVAIFQWDALISDAKERTQHVCQSLATESNIAKWQPKFARVLTELEIPVPEDAAFLTKLIGKVADIILRARVDAVVAAVSHKAVSSTVVADPGVLHVAFTCLAHFVRRHAAKTHLRQPHQEGHRGDQGLC
jgi:hypothetical protein